MKLCKVKGVVWSTEKSARLQRARLAVVQSVDHRGKDSGSELVAVDPLSAGPGQLVLVAEGAAARYSIGDAEAPIDAAVVALIADEPEQEAAADAPGMAAQG